MARALALALLALGGGALASAAAPETTTTVAAAPTPTTLDASDAAAAAMLAPLAAAGALLDFEQEADVHHGRALLEEEQEEVQQQQQRRRGGGFWSNLLGSRAGNDATTTTPQRRNPLAGLFSSRPSTTNDNNPPATTTKLVPEQGAASNALYASPPPSFNALITLDPSTNFGLIPQSFMGISHEWPFVEELAARPEYINLVRKMGAYGNGPPIVRIGGGSTDKLTAVPPQKVWDALKTLYAQANVRYILGLPLERKDAPLAKAIYEKARKELPADAILSFEVGNEPNFYGSGNAYVRTRFIQDWAEFVPQIACLDASKAVVDSAMGGEGSDVSSCEMGVFAGPVWGHVNVRPLTLDWFLYSHGRWVDLATVHWYKATSEMDNTAETLMDEKPVREEMKNFRELVRVAEKHGKPLRVAETNTISNSGKEGVSNVFAAALWTLDASLEVAAAGGSGVNFHQGAGQNLYTGILRWVVAGPGGEGETLNPPIVKPPYYGYLAFGQAVRGGSRFIRTSASLGQPEFLKVFPLQDAGTGALRVVLINKSGKEGGNVALRLATGGGGGKTIASLPAATVTRMVAKGNNPLEAKEGGGSITLGGVWLDVGGVEKGKATTESVKAGPGGGGGGDFAAWRVYMPPASAAIVEIPRF